jgi:ATP-dependent Clp endopeptidase proteolytic subunit ClpP|tara:strand:+ start:880 stop:1539 length:660 start_codon:yes stop_codon:yes gene_type:complete
MRFSEDTPKTEEKEEKEEILEEKDKVVFITQEPKLRTVGIMGEINDETGAEVVFGLLSLHNSAVHYEPADIEDEDSDMKEVIMPIDMVISTPGGNADDMFAIYDTMRSIRDEVPIKTRGIGKVMSAGVVLLAAGTKGERSIGKNCRIMLHSVIGGHVGPMHQLDNEMEEIRNIQDQYIAVLSEETKMTKRYLRNLLKKKVNIYLSATEAIELGIADKIF